jgi:hypothetical protein
VKLILSRSTEREDLTGEDEEVAHALHVVFEKGFTSTIQLDMQQFPRFPTTLMVPDNEKQIHTDKIDSSLPPHLLSPNISGGEVLRWSFYMRRKTS